MAWYFQEQYSKANDLFSLDTFYIANGNAVQVLPHPAWEPNSNMTNLIPNSASEDPKNLFEESIEGWGPRRSDQKYPTDPIIRARLRGWDFSSSAQISPKSFGVRCSQSREHWPSLGNGLVLLYVYIHSVLNTTKKSTGRVSIASRSWLSRDGDVRTPFPRTKQPRN
jgi:hypothetical protein